MLSNWVHFLVGLYIWVAHQINWRLQERFARGGSAPTKQHSYVMAPPPKRFLVLHHWDGLPKTPQEGLKIVLGEGYRTWPYNWIIAQDGTVWEGREESDCAANLGINYMAVAICFVGCFDSYNNPDGRLGPTVPTKAQCISGARVIKEVLKRHPGIKMILHRDVSKIVPLALYQGKMVSTATACPGNHFTSKNYGQILWKMVNGFTYEMALQAVRKG